MTTIAKLAGLTTPVTINYDMMTTGKAVFTVTSSEDEVVETQTTESKAVESMDEAKQEQTSPLDKARIAAKLKREKKAAAIVARAAGKVKADEERAKADQEHQIVLEKERLLLENKIAAARKAMGVRKNDQNPASIGQQIEQWRMESLMRIYKR